MEEGTFGGWLKQDGDAVRPGDPLFILEGEKAAQDIESLDAGILRIPPDAPQAGQTVKVGQVLAYLEGAEAGETMAGQTSAMANAGSTASTPTPALTPALSQREMGPSSPAASVTPTASPSVRRMARERGLDLAAISASGTGGHVTADDVISARQQTNGGRPGRLPISPRARRAARELNVDPGQIVGSGRGGRIRERDVRAALPTAANHDRPGTNGPINTVSGELLPLTALRRTIAARMSAAVHQAAPVTLHTLADATNLMGLRQQYRAAAAADTEAWAVPSYTDIIVKLAAAALARHPALTWQWRDEGLFQPQGMHLAVAVDTPAGLLAPVLRDVGQRTLRQVSQEMARLVEGARAGRLQADELQGGVFTVTNLGMFGIGHFTPILNLPQSAILGVGHIRQEPAIIDGQLQSRSILSLSLTFDHRAIDGAPAARFLQTLNQFIEQPAAWS